MGDVGGGEQHRGHGHKGKRKKKRRLGTRIDMTPMVDVAFLLLTFFMLTTTMTQPQVMEITLPPNNTPVEIAESNVMTVRVRGDGAIFWNIGSENPQKVEFKQVRSLLQEKNKENPKLATLIKIDRTARYQRLVDMLDELNLAEVALGAKEQRYSLATMTPEDLAKIASL